MGPADTISRRHALIAGLCLCCMPRSPRGAWARSASLTLHEIASGVYVRRGVDELATAHNEDAIANVGFVVGRDSVAVVDPGGSLADGERLRGAIRQVTQLPIRYVLMSHVHPDHIFGAGAFLPDKPTFIGHARLPQALDQRGEYYREQLEEVLGPGQAGPVVRPTQLIEREGRVDLGERVLELRAHGVAHTSNDLSVLDARTGTLFPSDLLFVGRIPSLDGSLTGWLKELAYLASLESTRAVPGHGPASVDFAAASAQQRRYLEALLNETREAIARGVEIDAAPATVAQQEREKWSLFDDYHGRNVTQAFTELEWE